MREKQVTKRVEVRYRLNFDGSESDGGSFYCSFFFFCFNERFFSLLFIT